MSTSWPQWLVQNYNVFTQLSYPTSRPDITDSFHDSNYYNGGRADIFFIVTCIAVMAILRDALRLLVFEPFARWKLMNDLQRKLAADSPRAKKAAAVDLRSNGRSSSMNGNGKLANGHGHTMNGNGLPDGVDNSTIKPTKKQLKIVHRSVLRFAEQGWSVLYYTFSWTFGLYVHYHLPTKVLHPVAVWEGYPHIPLATPVKFYYLVQTAFYVHQTLILNAEARRKDHVQMMAHHVITIGLLLLSYFTNFTRVGSLILLLMDFCDIFLPLAKMIRYLSISQLATDAVFGLFMVSWFVTRHLLFPIVIWSTTFDLPVNIPYLLDKERGFYLTRSAHMVFVGALLALQVLQCIWFWMICRVAYRVVTGSGAEDERSDDEIESADQKDN